MAASDEAGQLLWRKHYAPYGEQVDGDTDNEPLSYTGKQHDDVSGLTYFGARYYDPEVGRFMGVDPVAFVESNPTSFNRYVYVNNNPYKYVDPDGNYAELAVEIVSVSIGLASFVNNFSKGDYGAAAIDAGGVAIDTFAMAVPILPGFSGLGIKAAREGGEAVGKTYHRLGDSSSAIDKIEETGELLGNPPHNFFQSDIPKVKAFDGPLPEGKKGFEFTTPAVPDRGHVPGKPTWSAGYNPDVKVKNEQACIPCKVTKRTD